MMSSAQCLTPCGMLHPTPPQNPQGMQIDKAVGKGLAGKQVDQLCMHNAVVMLVQQSNGDAYAVSASAATGTLSWRQSSN